MHAERSCRRSAFVAGIFSHGFQTNAERNAPGMSDAPAFGSRKGPAADQQPFAASDLGIVRIFLGSVFYGSLQEGQFHDAASISQKDDGRILRFARKEVRVKREDPCSFRSRGKTAGVALESAACLASRLQLFL